jgi:hypothetical protein
MINKRIVEKKTYELIDSLAFKQYEVRAKDQEYNRLNGLPTFRVKEPNTGVIKSYTVQLTADFKNVKVVEHGIYDTEWGFLPLKKENLSLRRQQLRKLLEHQLKRQLLQLRNKVIADEKAN